MEVRVVNVRKEFDRFPALHDVSLDIRSSELIALLGPSGSGKTTLLRLIAGLERPTEGAIYFGDEDASQKTVQERNVGFVFQHYALFRHMTVAENIGFGLKVRDRSHRPADAEIKRRASELLDLVQLTGLDRRYPAQLSGGQRQRVALARAIVNRPRVLLLDEPLGALDLKLREQMQVELKTIQNEVAITFIYVTHDQDEALTMSDRIAVFDAGRVEQVGTPAEVYEQPQTPFVAGFVGVSNLLERDGGRFTIRPEKIHLLEPGEDASGLQSETGQIGHVSYAGSFTRYMVELDSGGELLVVRQNLETSSQEALEERGRKVTVGWRPEHAVAVRTETTREEEESP
jgi:ABC-type Fe3+/spermidine/putrescine transport system ATPase subunit